MPIEGLSLRPALIRSRPARLRPVLQSVRRRGDQRCFFEHARDRAIG